MNDNLLKGNVFKSLLAFAIPFMVTNLLQILYGMVDLIVVGRFASTTSISAVSIGSQMMSMITSLITGISIGTTILMGQYFGAKEEHKLAKCVGASIIVFGILSIILTVITVVFNQPLVSLMDTPLKAINQTRSYILICGIGTSFIIGYNVVSAILRGLGDSKTPVYFVSIACVINILLDLLFIGGFHLGAAGAALATIVAQACSFIFSLIFLKIRGTGFEFGWKDIRFHPEQIKKIIKIGFPIGLQNCLINLSFLIITAVINGMGLVASASVGVVEKLINLLMLPSIAMGSAISTMAAQNFGAKQYSRAREAMRKGIIFCLSISIFVTIFCQFFGTTLTSLFTSDQDVIKNAALYLQSYSVDCIFVSFVFCMNGYLNGAGYTMFTMAHSVITTLIIRIPLTMFFSSLSGVTLFVMGIASPSASLASVIVCILYIGYLNKKVLHN